MINTKTIHTIVFLGFAVFIIILSAWMFKSYVWLFFIVGIYCVLFVGLFNKISSKNKLNKYVNSIIVFVIFAAIIIVPLILISIMVASEIYSFIDTLKLPEYQSKFDETIVSINKILRDASLNELTINPIQLRREIFDIVSRYLSVVTKSITTVISVSLNTIINVFIFIILAVMLLPNWKQIVKTIKNFIPMKKSYTEVYFRKSGLIVKDVVKGTIIIAFIQGFLAGIFMAILGIPNYLLFAFACFILSIIPYVGTAIILIPIGIYLIFTGNYLEGTALILWQILVVSTVDNLIRPFLVSEEVDLHPIIMFFAYVAGIRVFGVVGLVLGPIIIVLLITTIEIFQRDFLKEDVNMKKLLSSGNKDKVRVFIEDMTGKYGVMKILGMKESPKK